MEGKTVCETCQSTFYGQIAMYQSITESYSMTCYYYMSVRQFQQLVRRIDGVGWVSFIALTSPYRLSSFLFDLLTFAAGPAERVAAGGGGADATAQPGGGAQDGGDGDRAAGGRADGDGEGEGGAEGLGGDAQGCGAKGERMSQHP